MPIDLSCAVLTAAYYLAEAAYADSAKKADYQVEVGVANALIENTTARIEVVNENNKKRQAKIYWTSLCNQVVSDETPDYCEISGVEADAECKTFDLSERVNAKFTIDEKNYANSNLDVAQVFADNMLKTMKALDEAVAQKLMAKLATFTSANLYQEGLGCTDETGNWVSTYINPSYWSPSIMAYFAKVSKMNKFQNPFLIDGGNLFDHYVAAMTNEGNANGKGAAAYFKMMKFYSDLFNVETVTPKGTYMIDRGATAVANWSEWRTATQQTAIKHGTDGVKYSIESKNIPGFKYDVYVKKNCSGKYEKLDVLIDTEFDLFNGASSCGGATGVLEFLCGACPTVEAGSGS